MDLPIGWFYQAVHMADNRGLAGTRQPHDTENLTLGDGETGIGNADHAIETP